MAYPQVETIDNNYPSGFQPTRPKELADAITNLVSQAKSGITAFAGGGQTSAVQLVGGANEIATCASASDSVKLPPAIPGMMVFLANNGAQTAKVHSYETSGVTIDGTSGVTGVNLAAAKNALYACVSTAKWESVLTA